MRLAGLGESCPGRAFEGVGSSGQISGFGQGIEFVGGCGNGRNMRLGGLRRQVAEHVSAACMIVVMIGARTATGRSLVDIAKNHGACFVMVRVRSARLPCEMGGHHRQRDGQQQQCGNEFSG